MGVGLSQNLRTEDWKSNEHDYDNVLMSLHIRRNDLCLACVKPSLSK